EAIRGDQRRSEAIIIRNQHALAQSACTRAISMHSRNQHALIRNQHAGVAVERVSAVLSAPRFGAPPRQSEAIRGNHR
ncbi:hypothetical protein Ctob_013013, partial [Chrysochromulina tobinii]